MYHCLVNKVTYMNNENHFFVHGSTGYYRPQIVLVGNGLEISCGQDSWENFVKGLKASTCITLTDEEMHSIPFPLLYQILCTENPAPSTLSCDDIKREENRLSEAVKNLQNKSSPTLNILPKLGADHVFTTNYSYCLEKAFFSSLDFGGSSVRKQYRFNYNPVKKHGASVRELHYRLHSGYKANNNDGSPVALWHIHGEYTVPRGIVLGHDRYGRLLSRIESICHSCQYNKENSENNQRVYLSWPELFIYGDVYVIGFGFNLCEYDLWWLLRRKQRERYADGKVFFYDNNTKAEMVIRDKLLQAHGVIINPDNLEKDNDYDAFYTKALENIKMRIQNNKAMRRSCSSE